MRRLIPAITAVLLTAACSSAATQAAKPAASPSPTPSTSAASPVASTPTPGQSPSPSAASPSPTGGPSGQPEVAIPASQLPYKPAAGAPALDNVTVNKTTADGCGIPADDSGNEAQLLNASLDGNVLITTFEISNPCPAQLSYDIDVTQAIGSATGIPGGPNVQTTTPVIQSGASISFNVNVDPKATLTTTQLQQLWVGVTHISRHAAS